jgi:hypothetical protein
MANKTQPGKESVQAFLDAIDDDARRKDCVALKQLIQKVTGHKPVMWGGSMVGFGTYHYVYDSGREGDFFRVGFAPRKAGLSVYLGTGYAAAPELLERLGKYKMGKACINLKRLSDIDTDVLSELIRQSEAYLTRQHG